ncbi:MAG: tetratricopeptide repeat protein [Candidatus Peribacteraceae bacterium]|nr:tetratricopeptide repeat protein [Candidatus Peribacteraceae bacterium]
MTIQERVIVYLSTIPDKYRESFDGPYTLTQLGIANSIGIRRQNVPLAVNALIEGGDIEARKVHIYGSRQKKTIYHLTLKGIEQARQINIKLSETDIEVIMLDGKREIHSVDKIVGVVPFSTTFLEVIRNISNFVLDCNNIHTNKIKRKKRFLDCSNGFANPPYFFGRVDEIKLANSWYESDNGRVLAISGIGGIGKSTFAATILRKWSNPLNAFKIHKWTRMVDILDNLGDFLSRNGNKKLMDYVHTYDEVDMMDLQVVFESVMKEQDIIIVFDDVHNANQEVITFFRMLNEVLLTTGSGRLVVIGRSIPNFYNRGKGRVSDTVKEINLSGLDKDSCAELLSKMGYEHDNIDKLYSSTNGHPLLVELSEGKPLEKSRNIQRYILGEFLSNLKPSERKLLEYISIFRYPVTEKEISPKYKQLRTLMDNGIVQVLPNDRFQIHDMIKEYLYTNQRKKQLLSNHSCAADFYIEYNDPPSTNEAIFHRMKADETDLATELIIEYGQELINNGYPIEVSGQSRIILSRHPELTQNEVLKLKSLMAEGSHLSGEWDTTLENHNEVIRLSEILEDKETMARAHHGLGEIYLRRDDYGNVGLNLEVAERTYAEIGDDKGLADTLYLQGVLYERKGMFDQAVSKFQECESIAKKNEDVLLLIRAYNSFGRIFLKKGEDDRARGHFEKAVVLLELKCNSKELARTYTNLGICAFNQHDIEESIKYHSKTIEAASKIGDIRILGHGFSNLASAYIEIQEYDLAIEHLEKARDIFEKTGEKRMLASVNSIYAVVWSRLEKWDKSIQAYQCSIELRKESNDIDGLAHSFYRFGLMCKKKGDIDKATDLLIQAKGIYEDLGNKLMIQKINGAMDELRRA